MSLLLWLFPRTGRMTSSEVALFEEPPIVVDELVHNEVLNPNAKYKNYAVEYYPFAHKYYALYKSKYLNRRYTTGIIETKDEMTWVDSFREEHWAWHMIDQHIEQQTKEGVKVIRRT